MPLLKNELLILEMPLEANARRSLGEYGESFFQGQLPEKRQAVVQVRRSSSVVPGKLLGGTHDVETAPVQD
jgi:hypothetical protein